MARLATEPRRFLLVDGHCGFLHSRLGVALDDVEVQMGMGPRRHPLAHDVENDFVQVA